MSIVQQKLHKSYHYCEQTKTGHVKNYADQFTIGNPEVEENLSSAFMTKDAAGNPLQPDYGYMEYEDV